LSLSLDVVNPAVYEPAFDRRPVNDSAKLEVKTILLVDDRDYYRLTTKWFLSSFGFVVECAASAEQALSVFDHKIHDLVIADSSIPGMNGVEMAHIIKLRSPRTPILLCTDEKTDCGACVDAVLANPVYLPWLKNAVERLIGDKTASEPISTVP